MWTTIIALIAKSKLGATAIGFVTKGKAKLILGVIVVALIFGQALYISSLKEHRDSLEVDLALTTKMKDMFVEHVKQCATAVSKAHKTIDDLEGANNRLAAASRVTEEEAIRMAAEAEARAKKAERELGELHDDLNQLRNEDASCAQIQDLDIESACPAAIERLRDDARPDSDN